MLRNVLLFGISSFILFNGVANANTEELNTLVIITALEQKEHDSILSQSESLLLTSKYDELDKIADNYRSTKEKFTDGEWKLSVFYDGMSYYLRQAPEDNWVNRLEKLRNWVSTKPNSITARVALAECLVGYAFHGRSGAYANKVKDDQWRFFYDRLKEALEVLEQAKKLQQKCPGWWAVYQRIALGGGWDRAQYDRFLDSAIAYEQTYNVYYFRAAYHLLPWWFGKKGDWEQFAKSMADRIGGQNGDILYAQIIWFMDRRSPNNVVDKNPYIDWQRVNNGIQAMKKLNLKVEWKTLIDEAQRMYSQGRYDRAEVVAKKALEVAENNAGPNQSNVAVSLNNLGTVLKAKKQYVQAELLFKRALEINKKAYGPDSLYITADLTNLAFLYKDQGQYAQAEPLYKRVLEIEEKALGPNHPQVAQDVQNLAAFYRATNRSKAADELDQRAAKIRSNNR